MSIATEKRGDAMVVFAHGRIDHATADAFSAALAPHVNNCTRDGTPLVLDFSGVEYISSVGLRVLMIAGKEITNNGGRIIIAGLQPLVQEVFQISRFYLVFKIADTIEAALETLKEAE